MADVQRQFEQFHNIIRTDYGMNDTLRKKRNIILRRIARHLRKNKRPGFKRLNQGSYKMKTGVIPVKGLEFDIDVGLRFGFTEKDYTADEVRSWVFEAVKGHTETVEEKGPCIRVTYKDGYHVDLVCYACWEDDAGETQFRLAHKTNGWCAAQPKQLIAHVDKARERFDGTDDDLSKNDQFRRSVRSLKRWNDIALPEESSAKPAGLAFVLLAIQLLPKKTSWDGEPDDRLALEQLARQASTTWGRIVAEKPTPEYEDMFGRLSDEEMDELKGRFGTLADTLVAADQEPSLHKACKLLQDVFGPDFPVPPEEETAKKTRSPAIIPSSESAA